MQHQSTQITITGYFVGYIWQPLDIECYKYFTYDLTREDQRFSEPISLRDHILHLFAENAGDFRHCEIADGLLHIKRFRSNGYRARQFDLANFPSIADCIKDDWCGPEPGDFE